MQMMKTWPVLWHLFYTSLKQFCAFKEGAISTHPGISFAVLHMLLDLEITFAIHGFTVSTAHAPPSLR